MLYPLSYGGANGQCNDLRVNPRWQGVTLVGLGEPSPRGGQRSTELVRVEDHVDGGDAIAADGEADDGDGLAAAVAGDDAGGPVDQRGSAEAREPWPGVGGAGGHGVGAGEQGGCEPCTTSMVGAERHVGVQQGQ